MKGAVKRDEFHGDVVRGPGVCFPRSVETKKKRNIIKWYARRLSFWNDCDELIQEWWNSMLEPGDSVNPPMSVEGQMSLECAV